VAPQIVDHGIWLRNSHNAASVAIVHTSPAPVVAVHKCDCACLSASTLCGSALEIQEGVPGHSRGSSESALGRRPGPGPRAARLVRLSYTNGTFGFRFGAVIRVLAFGERLNSGARNQHATANPSDSDFLAAN
jgi:hypothetical protein